jgi:hypothetical protein
MTRAETYGSELARLETLLDGIPRRSDTLGILARGTFVLLHPFKWARFTREYEEVAQLATYVATAYLTGVMDPADRAEFEALLPDPTFQELVGPVLTAWQFAEPDEVTPAEVDAAFAQFRSMVERES